MTPSVEVTRFRTLLATKLGWTFDDNDASQLAEVLDKRCATHGITQAGYLSRLATQDWKAELATLAEELTINETYFYRHGEQFRALAEVALPARIEDRSVQRVLRMMSVGCSSGEEAYTLAIVAREMQPGPEWITSVLGLDANPAVLRRAATARYSAWALRETPDAVRQRWFRPQEGDFELDARIRAMVQFRQYNVASDDTALWRPDQYDVVFCRNLLMYLTPEVRSSLVKRMTAALSPGGYLFLGHTDSLGSSPEGLEPQQTHHTFYYRRQQRASAFATPAPALRRRSAVPRPGAEAVAPSGPSPDDVHDRAMRLLLEERFAEALRLVEAGINDRPTTGINDPTATGINDRPAARMNDRPAAGTDDRPAARTNDRPAAGTDHRPASRELLLHGVLLAHAGRLDDAEMACRRLLETDGLFADAHHQLAVCLEVGAAVDVAIGHYKLAAYLDPEFAMPRLRLGLLARRRGENGIAGPELDRALILLRKERDERIALFGGGFGRIALTTLCRAELDACGAHR